MSKANETETVSHQLNDVIESGDENSQSSVNSTKNSISNKKIIRVGSRKSEVISNSQLI